MIQLYIESKKLTMGIKEKDKRRKFYYNRHTGQEWGMLQNYHLTLDSDTINIETCAKLIISHLK